MAALGGPGGGGGSAMLRRSHGTDARDPFAGPTVDGFVGQMGLDWRGKCCHGDLFRPASHPTSIFLFTHIWSLVRQPSSWSGGASLQAGLPRVISQAGAQAMGCQARGSSAPSPRRALWPDERVLREIRCHELMRFKSISAAVGGRGESGRVLAQRQTSLWGASTCAMAIRGSATRRRQ